MDIGLQTTKLSELPEAITLNESDYSFIVQNGTSKKIKGLLLKGNAGDNGKPIEIQKTDTHIQWRQEGGQPLNLIALADLKGDKGDTGDKGDNGKSIEIQKTDTHIQWRYSGESEWRNLIELESLKGPSGAKGETGQNAVNPNFTIGTVTTLPSGSDATVTLTGTYPNLVLNFGIPRDADGSSGGEVDLSAYATKTYTNNAISTALDGRTFKFLTQAEYDALETKDPLVEYHITDATDSNVDLSNYYTKTEVDTKLGNIDTILDNINGEVI